MTESKVSHSLASRCRLATWLAGTAMLMLANGPVSGQADQETTTITLESSESGQTKLPNGNTSVYSGDSGWVSVGKDFVSCSRFEGVAIPRNAEVEDAFIDLSCKNCRSDRLRVRICGEYTQPSAPLTEEPFSLSDLTWTRACVMPMPEDGGSLAQERFDIKPVVQEIVGAQKWESGNDLVVCFVDNGSRAKSVVSSTTILTATFMAAGVEPPPGDTADACTIDTNGDGAIDLTYPDSDGDYYCNFAAGTETFLGTLVLDQPFEITGDDSGGGGGVTFKGYQIVLVDGGEIISDFQSPVVSTSGHSSGLTLEFKAESRIALMGGIISNIGANDDQAGDIILRTELQNSRIRISGPLLLGEDLILESNGAVDIDGETVIGASGDVRISAEQSASNYDIELGGQTLIYTSNRIRFVNNSHGKVVLGEDVVLSAATIDFCGVEGGEDVIEFNGAALIGSILMPEDVGCQ